MDQTAAYLSSSSRNSVCTAAPTRELTQRVSETELEGKGRLGEAEGDEQTRDDEVKGESDGSISFAHLFNRLNQNFLERLAASSPSEPSADIATVTATTSVKRELPFPRVTQSLVRRHLDKLRAQGVVVRTQSINKGGTHGTVEYRYKLNTLPAPEASTTRASEVPSTSVSTASGSLSQGRAAANGFTFNGKHLAVFEAIHVRRSCQYRIGSCVA